MRLEAYVGGRGQRSKSTAKPGWRDYQVEQGGEGHTACKKAMEDRVR